MEKAMGGEAFLYAAGVAYVVLAGFHLAFWKLFRWRQELPRLTRLNRGAMQILNLFVTGVFLLAAYLCFAEAPALAGSTLGHALLVGLALLWISRAVEQVWFFGLRRAVSAVFTVLFVVMAGLHLAPLA
jgi:hypothetical protein